MEEENRNNDSSEEKKPEEDGAKQSRRGIVMPAISPIVVALVGLISMMVFYQIGGGILTAMLLGLDYKNYDPNMLRLLTMAGQMMFIFVPAIIFTRMFYKDVSAVIRFKFPKTAELGIFFIGIIIVIPIVQTLSYLQTYLLEKLAEAIPFLNSVKNALDQFDSFTSESMNQFLSIKSPLDSFLLVMVVAIVPAVCEEFFFRGFVQRSMEFKLKPFWAILATAALFSINHLNPYQFFPIMVLGAFLGYAAYKTNSIFVPIFLHFINNLVMLLFLFAAGSAALESKPAAPITNVTPYLIALLLSSILFAVWFLFVRYYYSRSETN